jgi:hypothetical protein
MLGGPGPPGCWRRTAHGYSATQLFPAFMEAKVHSCVHKNRHWTLSWVTESSTFALLFSIINLILPLTSTYVFMPCLSFSLPDQNVLCISIYYMVSIGTCNFHHAVINFITVTISEFSSSNSVQFTRYIININAWFYMLGSRIYRSILVITISRDGHNFE